MVDLADGMESLTGRICVVTGGNAGIGFVTARELCRRGALVWLVGRNKQRCDQAVATIRATLSETTGTVEDLVADLSVQADVHSLADGLSRRLDRIDILVNNAGAMFPKLETSADAIEMTFALNQLAYYTLSLRLLDLLRASEQARIVNVASDAHRAVRTFDVAAFTRTSPYNGWRAYCQSKLANVLFSGELARRLEGTSVTCNALHPGFVASNFLDISGIRWKLARVLSTPFALSSEAGARTSLYAAAGPDTQGLSGRYFTKSRPVEPSPVARDAEHAKRLWGLCEELTKVKFVDAAGRGVAS
jgi:NAD(P)-dependent dehydrogenase (short-subunit alcohol dehydrogenase family)